MAVYVIRTIASRALRIFGSGTRSTRTSFGPIQQFALKGLLLSGSLGESPASRRPRSGRVDRAANEGVADGIEVRGRAEASTPRPPLRRPSHYVRVLGVLANGGSL